MSEVGEISVKISSTTKEFDQGVKKVDRGTKAMQKDIKKLGKTLEENANKFAKWGSATAGAMAVAGAAIVSNSLKSIKELKNLSDTAGLTVEAFQRGAFAAEQFGISQEKFGDILKDMDDRIGDFISTGAGPMVDFFEQIAPKVGVTAESFRDLNSKDALQLFVSSLEKANVSQKEMTFYMEAIASDSTRLLPLLKDNGKLMGEMSEQAKQAGIGLSSIEVDNAIKAQREMSKLGGIIESTVLQSVAGASDEIALLGKELQDPDTIKGAQELTRVLVSGFTKVVGLLAEMPQFARFLGETLAEAIHGPDTRLGKLNNELEEVQENLKAFNVNKFGQLTGKVESAYFGLGQTVASTTPEILAEYNKLKAKAKELADEMMKLQTEQAKKPVVAAQTKTDAQSDDEGIKSAEVRTLADIRKSGEAQLRAVQEYQESIRQTKIASYATQLEDLKASLNNNQITQAEFDAKQAALLQAKSDLENNVIRMTYEQQRTALAAHQEKMLELGAQLRALNADLSGDNINPKQYEEKLKELQEKLKEHQTAVDEIKGATIDNGDQKADPITEYQQETVGLLEAMGLRFQTAEEMQIAANERELNMLKSQLEKKAITEEQYAERSAQIKRSQQELERSMLKSNLEDGFQIMAKGSKKIAKVQEAVALYQAGVKGAQSAVDAWQAGMSTGGPFAPMVAAAYTAASLAKTAMLIKQIKGGGQKNGTTGGGGSGSVPTPASVTPASGGGESGGPSRVFNIDFVGESSNNAQQTRNLLELINEQSGDNVEINLRG